MDIDQFKTTSQWYRKMKAEGFEIPLALYHALIKLTKDKHISFQEAYQDLESEGRIKVINKTITFDLNEKERSK